MKIVDCFPYFNEKELLELRINLLKNKVDKFIICEANHTHKGEPKTFTCKNTLFELGLMTDKIQVIELNVPGYSEEPNVWVRERMQRNAIANYIENGDVCYISDCDEIINPKLIEYYVSIAIKYPNNILRVPLAFLHGRADLRVYSDDITTIPWNVPFICTKNHLEVNTLSDIREAKSLETNTSLDIYITENEIVEDAGWHFNWMGNTERKKLKLNSFLHWKEVSLVENYIPKENSTDCLGRQNHILKKYPIHLLPQKIFEFPKVKEFLLPFTLNDLLISFIHNPNNSENNFLLALHYHNIGQTASALSYYLRTAERTDDKLFQYECLIKASMCFDEQGCRSFTVKGLLQHAVSILSKRPEAYYLLSRFYEKENDIKSWKDSYMIASIGEQVSDFNCESLRTEINYPGKYGILFQKAVASWWCGLCDESRDIFNDLLNNYELDENHRQAVLNNVNNIKRL